MWVLAEDCTTGFKVRLVEATSLEQTIRVGIANNKWVFYNGSASDLLFTMLDGVNDPIDNTWYHLKIHFRCNGAPAYQGLNQNKVKIVVDGYASEEVMVWNNKDNVNRLTFTTGAAPSTDGWVDAIAYSWNPYYSIGDNLNEGLLLGYDNITNLDWQVYSLDGQTNKTILGNTTIPMPIDGIHSIQVFGNDSISTMYESNTRYFSVDTTPYINISTPENITYTEPMSGYYPATFGFENEVDGTSRTDITYVDYTNNIQSNCYVDIVNNFQGHNKVLRIYDQNTAGNAEATNQLDSLFANGTVEFWWLVPDATDNIMCYQFYEGGTWPTVNFAGSVFTDNGYFVDSQGTNILAYNVDQWYHFKIIFNTITDQYDLYIDNVLLADNCNFTNPVNNIGIINIKGQWSTTGQGYFDAIGYSWDPNYNIGDNLNEGLLLSYENTTNLDWKGYSLDGYANKTILGNVTIPIPNDGLHTVQVFGNDSLGTMHESDVRYFTTNSIGPDITINNPISNQLYGTTPPDFSLSIPDTDLDATWYSLDGGTTNIPFSGLSGTIDQTEWDKMGNGTVTITFYANDTANNIGQAGVTVRKDIIAPVITIISPTTAEEFDYTPIFDITIAEANLDEFWYTIDNGANNYTISSLTGTINQTAWGIAPDGPVTIRFYARDDVGNIGTNSVIVAKIPSDLPTPPPGIPGYNLVAIIGITVIVTAIIAYRKPTRK